MKESKTQYKSHCDKANNILVKPDQYDGKRMENRTILENDWNLALTSVLISGDQLFHYF